MALFSFPAVAVLAFVQTPAAPHLDLVVDLDIDQELITAKAVLTAPRSAWAQGWALNAALDVTEAHPDLSVGSAHQDGLNLLRLEGVGPGDELLTAHFSYTGVLSRDRMPFPLDRIAEDAVELSANSVWVPVHATFSTGYSVDVRIAGLPADWTLIAPGAVTRGPDGVRRVHRSTPDLDLALFAAPDLSCREDGAFTICARDPEALKATVVSRHGAASLALFTALFGAPEIAETRIALVERDRPGGYARAGYMVIDLSSGDSETHLAGYVAHEFAHSWFFAPIGSPNDHWLVEAPAEYAAWRYMETAFGATAREALDATARSRAAGAGPLSGAGRASHAALYNAGPVFLTDLEARIGRDALDAILRRTLSDPVMTTEGFLNAVHAIAGPEETAWARARIFEG